MIAYIKGALVFKSPTHVVIETNGLGYHVNISLPTYEKVQALEECLLHTHFHVKEDSQTLYGFWTVQEKKMFQHLISVSGVGPNTARVMLSSMSYEEIHHAIVQGNVKLLQSIKGIGPKSAQRMILELRDKVAREELPTVKGALRGNTSFDDALMALTALGISRTMATKALNKAANTPANDTVEKLVKAALKLL